MAIVEDGSSIKKLGKKERVSVESKIEWEHIKSVNEKIDRMPIEARSRLSLEVKNKSNGRIRYILQETRPSVFTAEILHKMHLDENESTHSKQDLMDKMLDECKGCHRLADQVLARWIKESKRFIAKQSSHTTNRLSVEIHTEEETITHIAEPMAVDNATENHAERSSVTLEGFDGLNRPHQSPEPVAEPTAGNEMAVQTVVEEEESIATNKAIGTKRRRVNEEIQAQNGNDGQEREKRHRGFDKCMNCLEKSASLEIQNIVLKTQINQTNNFISRERHEEDMGKMYKEIGKLHEMMTKAESSSANQVRELERYNNMLKGQNIMIKQQQQAVVSEFVKLRNTVQTILQNGNFMAGASAPHQMTLPANTMSQVGNVSSVEQRVSSVPMDSNVMLSNNQPSLPMPGIFPHAGRPPQPFQYSQLIPATVPSGGQRGFMPNHVAVNQQMHTADQRKSLLPSSQLKLQQIQEHDVKQKTLQQQHEFQQDHLLLRRAQEYLQNDPVQQHISMQIQDKLQPTVSPTTASPLPLALKSPAQGPMQQKQGTQTVPLVIQSQPQLRTSNGAPTAQYQDLKACTLAPNGQRRFSEGLKIVSMDDEMAKLERRHEADKRLQSEGGVTKET